MKAANLKGDVLCNSCHATPWKRPSLGDGEKMVDPGDPQWGQAVEGRVDGG